jgi:hypothetical protein
MDWASVTHQWLIRGRPDEFFRAGHFKLNKPVRITFDEDGRLHSYDGQPAIEFEEGIKVYFWHGIEMPEKVITKKEATKEEILSIKNVEVRRAWFEVLGMKYLEVLDFVVVDKKIRGGLQYELYRTRKKDDITGEKIQVLKMQCPTGRTYFECVPPEIRDIDEARAWQWGLTKEEYEPYIET